MTSGVDPGAAGVAERPLWRVEFDASSCSTYEVDSMHDYLQLVARYPLRRAGGLLSVDWTRVAVDHHAVHLTTLGLLDTHGASAVVDGHSVALSGWDCECACWLRRPPGLVVRPGGIEARSSM